MTSIVYIFIDGCELSPRTATAYWIKILYDVYTQHSNNFYYIVEERKKILVGLVGLLLVIVILGG